MKLRNQSCQPILGHYTYPVAPNIRLYKFITYLRLFLSKFKDSQRVVWLPLLLRKMFALWCLQRAFVLGLELCPAY